MIEVERETEGWSELAGKGIRIMHTFPEIKHSTTLRMSDDDARDLSRMLLELYGYPEGWAQ